MATGERLSVVLPSWREGETLLEAIRAARTALGECELVVAASEEAETVRGAAIAEGVIWVDAKRACRGAQLRQGAEVASGDPLMFLHVDTRLPEQAGPLVREALASRGVVGGAFRLRYDHAHPVLDLLSAMSRLTLTTSFLGDQCLFCSRTAYFGAGGFRDSPLFEDVDLAHRLARVGRLVRLPRSVTTSARRFTRVGPTRQVLKNSLLMAAYHAGVSPERLHALYASART